ncbi:OmpA family protein [Tunicatimonas pelagia]|uniref:OmpA family protein n=1 Tax=Tunicatimonas pelagia TaxID=931531 RepID=UPI0026655BBA|nr:OmpA family protein [Tunicatimonas pelagia]WKN44400.1 OmpA family protein [Tunicatimonas pelagia]
MSLGTTLNNHFTEDILAEELPPGVYLVVGAFEYEDNAKKYTEHVAERGLSAQYAFYPKSGYFYVYTSSAISAEEVTSAYQELRTSQEFSEAWILVAEEDHLEVEWENSAAEESSSADTWDDPISEPLARLENLQDSTPAAETIPSPVSPVNTKEQNSDKIEKLSQKPILHMKFQATQEDNEQSVVATVQVVEGARSRNLGEVSTDEVLSVDKTEVLDSALQIIPYAMGYRKVQFDLPLNLSSTDSAWQLIQYEGDTLVMDMPLQRLEKGDIQIMFNTYFYGNSSVMRERSRYEMNELVKMLKEKPDMRIKLHGHTNGSGRGFIYIYSPESKNFFDLIQNKEHKKNGVGSIKLSALRTETIKSYLEHKGISGDRIETQGWGGKRMIYPNDTPLSKHNIRVEIEVL